MKKIYIMIVLILMSSQLVGQNNNQLNDMIVESLRSYISYSAELQKKVCASCEEDDTYICKDGLPSNFPYNSLPNATFFSVNFFKTYSNPLKKQLKKGIGTLFVSFELNNNQLKIMVTSRTVKIMNKTTIGTDCCEWGIYFYEYFCDKQEWVLKESKYGGI